jgi:hypothetical protein
MRAIFWWCYILFLVIVLNFVVVGKMPRANWDKLELPEKKAILCLLVDHYFKVSHCGQANFRLIEDADEITLHAECVSPEWEA